jgi:hypothetical protein
VARAYSILDYLLVLLLPAAIERARATFGRRPSYRGLTGSPPPVLTMKPGPSPAQAAWYYSGGPSPDTLGMTFQGSVEHPGLSVSSQSWPTKGRRPSTGETLFCFGEKKKRMPRRGIFVVDAMTVIKPGQVPTPYLVSFYVTFSARIGSIARQRRAKHNRGYYSKRIDRRTE